MCRRMLGELHSHASAVGLLQCEDEAAVTVWEVLMHDFQLAIKLGRFAFSRLKLGRDGRVIGQIAILRIVCENECAAEQHHGQCDEEATSDPRGTDGSDHVRTFLQPSSPEEQHGTRSLEASHKRTYRKYSNLRAKRKTAIRRMFVRS